MNSEERNCDIEVETKPASDNVANDLSEIINSLEKGDKFISDKIKEKSSKPVLRVKPIVLDTKEDRDYLEECENFLSNESIMKIILEKKCCKHNCLAAISPDYLKGDTRDSHKFVYLMRRSILGRTKKDRTQKVLELIEGSLYFNYLITDSSTYFRVSQALVRQIKSI